MADPTILALAACFCKMQTPSQECSFLIHHVAGNQSAIIDVVMHLADLCGTNVCCRKARETLLPT